MRNKLPALVAIQQFFEKNPDKVWSRFEIWDAVQGKISIKTDGALHAILQDLHRSGHIGKVSYSAKTVMWGLPQACEKITRSWGIKEEKRWTI